MLYRSNGKMNPPGLPFWSAGGREKANGRTSHKGHMEYIANSSSLKIGPPSHLILFNK